VNRFNPPRAGQRVLYCTLGLTPSAPHRRLDQACASGSAVAIEEAVCSYGNVLHASEQFEFPREPWINSPHPDPAEGPS